MKQKSILLCVSIILLLSISCSRDETYTIEIKDGVRHVHNTTPKWGDVPKIELKFVRQFGELEGVDDNYLLFLPGDFALDKEDNLYVLDRGNFRIQKYDPEGKFVASYGRQGQGPSEFQGAVVSIDIDDNGNMYINDFTPGFIMVMSPEGKELRRIRIDLSSGLIRFLRDGSIIQKSFEMDSEGNVIMLTVYDRDGTFIKNIGIPEDYEKSEVTWEMNRFYYTIDNEDNVYIAYSRRNAIEKYTPDNKLVLRIDRKLNYDTNFDIMEYKRMRSVRQNGKLVGRKEETHYTVENTKSVSRAIAVDGKGRIWVVTYRRQPLEDENAWESTGSDMSGIRYFKTGGNTNIVETDMFVLEIFDKDGMLLGKIPLTHFVNGMRIYGDRLFILDKLRKMCVYEYKIIEK